MCIVKCRNQFVIPRSDIVRSESVFSVKYFSVYLLSQIAVDIELDVLCIILYRKCAVIEHTES